MSQLTALSFQDHDMSSSNHLKDPCVTLNHTLNLDVHTHNICLSGSRTINALKILSRSIDFNYSQLTWFLCGRRNGTKLAKICERFIRFLTRIPPELVSSFLSADICITVNISVKIPCH